MPPRRSIAVYLYRSIEPRFLLLKRVEKRGGFWQPVTGSVEQTDGLVGARARYVSVIAGARAARGVSDLAEREDLMAAALREVEEETGLTDVLTVVDLGLESRFTGVDSVTYHERAFAAEVPDAGTIQLSHEHEDAKWVTLDDALDMLRYEENKDALRALVRFLAAGDDDSGLEAPAG